MVYRNPMAIRMCFFLFLMSSFIPLGAFATTYTWNDTGSGSWDVNANWAPSSAFPNGVGDVAIFGNSITAASIVDFSNTSPANITIGRIDFDSSSFMYTLQSIINPQMITYQTSSGNAQFNVKAGAQDVVCDFNAGALITFELMSSLDCTISAGRTLTFTVPIISGSGTSLNLKGPGTLRFEGGGGAVVPDINIQAGVLELNLTPLNFISANYNITGGVLKNLNNNQLNGFSPGPNLTIDGGTWDMNGFTDGLNQLIFNSGSLLGNSQGLVIAGGLTMRNVVLNGNLSLLNGFPVIISYDSSNSGTAKINGNIASGVPFIFDISSGPGRFDMIVSGAIQGSQALSKTGAGTLLLDGVNTHTGAMTISNGALLIGSSGSLSDQTVNVSQGAVFGGNGQVGTGTAIVNNSGILSPGLSPGVFTINGTYTQTATGVFSEELQTLANSDKLVVNSGAVNLAGTLDITLLPDHFLFGKSTLTIIENATGSGVSGTFETVNQLGFPSDTFLQVLYQPNEVLLSMHIPDTQALSPGNITAPLLSQISQNTLNFTRHLQKIRPLWIKKHPECVAAGDALNSDSLVASSTININFSSDKDRDEVYRSPFGKTIGYSSYIGLSPQDTWGVFGDVIGSVGRVYTTASNYPFRYYNVGGVVGFDYVGENYAVGISPGYTYLDATALNHQNKFHIQSAEGTFFATVVPFSNLNLFVDFIGGGAYQWYHFQRNTPNGIVHGDSRGGQWNVYSDIGYTFNASSFLYASKVATPLITPWVGLGYMGVHVDGYHEKGSSFQIIDIGSQTIQSLRSSLGLTLDYIMKWDCFSFFPQARVLWQREFLNHDRRVSYSHLPELNSQIQVFGLGRDSVFIGALLRLLFKERTDLYGSYDYEWNESFHSHLFLVGSEHRF